MQNLNILIFIARRSTAMLARDIDI